MKTNRFKTVQNDGDGFDLIRLSRSKQTVDISPNTLRAYHADGLPFYRRKGEKAIFVSKSEIESFIKKSPLVAA